MISYDFDCKFETITTFLKSPFNLSSTNSEFFSSKTRNEKMKNDVRNTYVREGMLLARMYDYARQWDHHHYIWVSSVIGKRWSRFAEKTTYF